MGRFFSLDPIAEDYPNQTTYQFASNNPVWKVEIEGLEGDPTTEEDLMNGLGYEIGIKADTQSQQVGEGGFLSKGYFSSAISAVEDVLGAGHNALSNAITSTIVAVVGTASSDNTLSDSQFSSAIVSGSENDVFTGLEQEAAVYLNAVPEVLGEASAMIIEGAAMEVGAAAFGPKLPAKSTRPATVTGAETLSPGRFANGSIPARSTARNFNKAERSAINKIGAESGCHNCGITTAGTKSGNFILDHQPPSALAPVGTQQSLYPHCTSCSSKQGGTVSGIVRKRNK